MEEFRKFPFLNSDNTIANLSQELPTYLAAANGFVMANEDDKIAWWAANSDAFPPLGSTSQDVFGYSAKRELLVF